MRKKAKFLASIGLSSILLVSMPSNVLRKILCYTKRTAFMLKQKD